MTTSVEIKQELENEFETLIKELPNGLQLDTRERILVRYFFTGGANYGYRLGKPQ